MTKFWSSNQHSLLSYNKLYEGESLLIDMNNAFSIVVLLYWQYLF